MPVDRTGLATIGILLMSTMLHAQSLTDARSLGLGASLAAIRDTRDFAANPAGLIHIRDWDLSLTTYTEPSYNQSGFVFQGISLGKRLFDGAAAAFRYTPGTNLTFVVPPVLLLGDSNLPESADREFEYREPFTAGVAVALSERIAAGIGIRNRQERVTDTRYQLIVRDTIAYPVASQETYNQSVWLADLGVQWEPSARWGLALVGRNLIRISWGDGNDVLETFRLPDKIALEGGLHYVPVSHLALCASASTAGIGGVGAQWLPGSGFAIRGSVLANRAEKNVISAFTAGFGWSYDVFDVDAAYLHFLSKGTHRGSSSLDDFAVDDIVNLDFHPYSRDRIVLSARAMFGRTRESLARIEGVTMTGGVYPAAREVFAYKPIGSVKVRNISSQPIHAKATFYVDRLMDAPTESQPVYLMPGGEADIPLTAVFNDRIGQLTSLTIKEGDVFIHATPAEQYDDRAQTRVVFHGRNAWDGDVNTLRYFVTPDDPVILKYSRDVLLDHRDSLARVDGLLEQFTKARLLLASFTGRLQYVNDPRLTADFVQYPVETVNLRGGDCDDLAVCFASLLASVGIATAFVDVIPPGNPDQAHLFLLVDTGLEPRFGSAIAQNPKRYVIRRGTSGKDRVWIPVETTMIARGFEEAWSGGAQQYFDDVEVGLGLAHGWVRIVDLD